MPVISGFGQTALFFAGWVASWTCHKGAIRGLLLIILKTQRSHYKCNIKLITRLG